MIDKILLACAAALLISGCASAGSERPTSRSSALERMDTSPLNFVDRSSKLSLFTDAIIGGGSSGGFFAVNPHTISYAFDCSGNDYLLNFSSAPEGKEFGTRLTEMLKNNKNLSAEKADEINQSLSRAELVGPVGLRCSVKESSGQIRLTIGLALRDTETYTYKFTKENHVLNAEDFS
ncbi:hypothetical protein [Litorimonas haliclonae]|uniref:hypothetical protein n=1 Tax=Litorimonas haliclonae TaxID=2081977 RepID=UPI0039F0C20D